ncbi:methyltransferase type 11 [Verrucosispora sp. WMMC514]|uniref:methyltransferase type 11 n=1 Tax=Verrucosispora sp. WMMC514 TaxID=3015156 RepID=UPI00248C0FAF|nr:methyltransferase type 11 [Verrucosispora sp. WMMC514]WBB90931.1 methyltransferase type 11 [Verrucosispora sp. WMMC514]
MRQPRSGPADTQSESYTQRLRRLSGARWKRWLDVQAPYRWNLRRLKLGRTLDVGSGLGRNLVNLGPGAVGVDHNPTSVAHSRALGLEAYTAAEFFRSKYARPDTFDSLLAAHLLEHLPVEQAREVVAGYLPFVRSGGRAVFITPQERGYRSDASHVRFVGFDETAQTCQDLGLTVLRQYSFPFHRAAGTVFTYNEFVTVARLP